jgi:hypothetical protein
MFYGLDMDARAAEAAFNMALSLRTGLVDPTASELLEFARATGGCACSLVGEVLLRT